MVAAVAAYLSGKTLGTSDPSVHVQYIVVTHRVDMYLSSEALVGVFSTSSGTSNAISVFDFGTTTPPPTTADAAVDSAVSTNMT